MGYLIMDYLIKGIHNGFEKESDATITQKNVHEQTKEG